MSPRRASLATVHGIPMFAAEFRSAGQTQADWSRVILVSLVVVQSVTVIESVRRCRTQTRNQDEGFFRAGNPEI